MTTWPWTAVAVGAVGLVPGGPTAAAASENRWHAALEAGSAWQTRNDIRIPGDGVSLVELADCASGRADNDEVYTFALFHHAVAGVRVHL